MVRTILSCCAAVLIAAIVLSGGLIPGGSEDDRPHALHGDPDREESAAFELSHDAQRPKAEANETRR